MQNARLIMEQTDTTPQSATNEQDEQFMRMALEEARRAYRQGEVPIGAVVVLSLIHI